MIVLPGHQRDGKKGDTNENKGGASKPEDKGRNTTGTAGAHVGEVTTPEDSTAPSNGSSIGAHVLEVAKHKFRPAQSVEELLGAHLINDTIWGCTDPGDVSVDTANSKEVMTGSHIMEQHTYNFCSFDQHELLNVTT